MERYYIVFEGIVQGVGFRYTSVQIANKYNLTGYVKNANNGNVEVEVQGNKESIDSFLSDMLKEKTYIKIFDYHIKKIPIKQESSFTVEF